MTPRTLYFAYGSNMDLNRMAGRCRTGRRVGEAVLTDWRFRIMSRGYATIVPEPGAVVWGLLWDLGDEDVASLDRYEGVGEGLYFKDTVRVTDTTGVTVDVLTYIAAHEEPGTPEEWYLDLIVDGARDAGFPQDYVAELESWRR